MEVDAPMDVHENVENMPLEMKKLMGENRENCSLDTSDGLNAANSNQILMSNLLSRLEFLKQETAELSDPCKNLPHSTSASNELSESVKVNLEEGDVLSNRRATRVETEEILKELREVRRQNSITHWLLSTLIFVTFTWQLSEVSILMLVKDKVSHPLKAIGNMVRSIFRGGTTEPTALETALDYLEKPSQLLPVVELLEIPEVNTPLSAMDRK